MAKRNGAKSNSKAGKTPRSTSVPGTFRGFSLQVSRFLFHLMSCGMDDFVCLEAFEDVGVEGADGSIIAEQTKSYLSANPLADRSKQLWKTLSNWLSAVQSGLLPLERTRFVIYANSKSMGDVAKQVHAVSNSGDAAAVITFCKTHLGYPNGLSEDAETRQFILSVLDGNASDVAKLVSRIQIELGSADGANELVQVFKGELISDDNREEVIQWALGWVKLHVDKQVALGQPGRVLKSDFYSALLNYVRSHDRNDILKSYAGSPDQTEIDEELRLSYYVRQLHCIKLDEVDVLAAVNDFLRAEVDRTKWSELGHVNESSFDAFAGELETTWRNKLRRVAVAHKNNPDEEKGQVLYSDCIEHAARLDGLDTPGHFVRGSWHVLADDASIGWHPRYKDVIVTPDGSERKRDE